MNKTPKKKGNGGRRPATQEAKLRAKDKSKIKNELLNTISIAGEIRNVMREKAFRAVFRKTQEYLKENSEKGLHEQFGPKNVSRIPDEILDTLNLDDLNSLASSMKEISKVILDNVRALEGTLGQRTKEDDAQEDLDKDDGMLEGYDNLFKKWILIDFEEV